MVKTKIATATASRCVRALSRVKPCAQCWGADTASNCNRPNISSSKRSADPINEVSVVISFLAWGVACGSLEPPG